MRLSRASPRRWVNRSRRSATTIGTAVPVILLDGEASGLDDATAALLTDLCKWILIAGVETSVSPGIEADAAG